MPRRCDRVIFIDIARTLNATQRLAEFFPQRDPRHPVGSSGRCSAASHRHIDVRVRGSTKRLGDRRRVGERRAARGSRRVGPRLRSSPGSRILERMASHALDLDDRLPSPAAIPAPRWFLRLAVAEVPRAPASRCCGVRLGSRGEDRARALRAALHHGWHSTATLGAFSATRRCCTLWKLDRASCRRLWARRFAERGARPDFGTMTSRPRGNAASIGACGVDWAQGLLRTPYLVKRLLATYDRRGERSSRFSSFSSSLGNDQARHFT